MGKQLDDFVKELQEQIYTETKEAYGDAAFERWLNPRFMGVLEAPDGHAVLRGKCGDTMEIYLKFQNDKVREASFRTDGCGSSTVCGSLAAEMAVGQGPDDLIEITGDAIIEKLGGLPKEDEHCAFLAAETLQAALHDYMSGKKDGQGG